TYPALHSIPPLNLPRSPIFWITPVFLSLSSLSHQERGRLFASPRPLGRGARGAEKAHFIGSSGKLLGLRWRCFRRQPTGASRARSREDALWTPATRPCTTLDFTCKRRQQATSGHTSTQTGPRS